MGRKSTNNKKWETDKDNTHLTAVGLEDFSLGPLSETFIKGTICFDRNSDGGHTSLRCDLVSSQICFCMEWNYIYGQITKKNYIILLNYLEAIFTGSQWIKFYGVILEFSQFV